MTQDEGSSPVQPEATPEEAAPAAAASPEVADGADRAATLEARVAELEQSLANEREAANDYMQRWQRAQADFANFRRRSQQEQEQRETLALGRALSAMLPALDSFERAFQTLPQSLRMYSWIDGMALIDMQLRRALEIHGVKAVEAAPGGAFDPQRHESIGAVETSAHAEGQIAAVIQNGYELRGVVLRPALVQLAKAPAAAGDSADAANADEPPASEPAPGGEQDATLENAATAATSGAGSRSTSEDS